MELTFTVFQRRRGRHYEWFTIGLGPFDQTWRGANQAKVESSVTEALRKALADKPPEVVQPLEMVAGRTLQVVDLSLSLSSRGKRLHGRFPLVVEPRSRGPGAGREPLRCVYHPLRSGEWFPWPEGESLAERAAAYFRERWDDLSDEALDDLLAHSRDRLRIVSMSVGTKNLRAKLEKPKKTEGTRAGGGSRVKGRALLAQLAVDETRRAIDGRLPCGMPRRPLRDRLAQLVGGRRRVSVLLVGPSGCGKSTLVRQLVHDRLAADDYPSHRNYDRLHPVFRLAGRRIIAGMSYLGQWEQRCVDVVEAARQVGAVLWVEDVHAWGRLGETQQSDRSLATFFRGPVARGELAVVGECTGPQYQQLQDDALGFASAFTTLFVEPTEEAETMRMLVHEARALELRHRVAFDPRALRTIYELGGSLGSASAHPGRAVDLLRSMATVDEVRHFDLREAEAAVRRGRKIEAIKVYRSVTGEGLKDSKDAVERYMAEGRWSQGGGIDPPPTVVRSERARDFGTHPEPSEIGPQTVVRRLAQRTGMPEVLLSPQQPLSASRVRSQLEGQIMGQEAAVEAMTRLVLRIKAGLTDPSRPWGVYLFTGPTGTGKTEMAKCLAEYLYGSVSRLVRFDMSEYGDPGAPARLIGDRARPEGALTSRVRVQPFCVVLLDEIEKAHPSVLSLMLQLFDDGRLTDAAGTLVDFTHVVVVMTSNLGARAAPPAGFGSGVHASAVEVSAAVREFFPPELFNRIDRVVRFEPLTPEAATAIARRELERLLTRRGLTERNVFVRFTESVVHGVVRDAFDPRYGARSLKRWLEDHVGAWLADEIAGQPVAGLRVLWLHRGPEGLRLHAELLTEAEVWGEPGPFEEMLEWNAARLRDHVPDALAQIEQMKGSPRLEALSEALRGRLAASVRGDADAADTVFNLEGLRGELRRIHERLRIQAEYDPQLVAASDADARADHDGELIEASRFNRLPMGGDRWSGDITVRVLSPSPVGPSLPMRRRPDFVGALADLHFMREALRHADDPGCHAVLLELCRVTRPDRPGRFDRTGPGLVEQLCRAYLRRGRGELEAWDVDGDGHTPMDERLGQANERVVMRLLGPAVRSFFAGEQGSHVRTGLSGGSEVVRVRVLDGAIDPADHVARLARGREAFVAALEAGADPLPENPDAVLPIVRRYRFDPPGSGELASIEIEDYPLAHAVQTRARSLSDVLPSLWLLRVGQHREGEQA